MLLEAGELCRGTVRGQHDLLVGVVQRVEGVEELLLRRFLPGNELNIVHQQHIG